MDANGVGEFGNLNRSKVRGAPSTSKFINGVNLQSYGGPGAINM